MEFLQKLSSLKQFLISVYSDIADWIVFVSVFVIKSRSVLPNSLKQVIDNVQQDGAVNHASLSLNQIASLPLWLLPFAQIVRTFEAAMVSERFFFLRRTLPDLRQAGELNFFHFVKSFPVTFYYHYEVFCKNKKNFCCFRRHILCIAVVPP